MTFPFSAVVGQDEAKLALLLAAAEPRLGGVLLRGEKGSAKTTLARGLAALLAGEAPFVELPIGATEDRVVGSIDLAAALTNGETRFHPGLLAAAHGGVLYVDEINLLPDHLVDVLLDVAASGVNRVEREGISHTHASRFVLIGSMNPEEGDLRPQLLDRFGLAVDVRASTDPTERAEAVRRRLAWDTSPLFDSSSADAALARRLAATEPAVLPAAIIDAVSALCVAVGAEGLRADLTICRAAAALAGWDGRPSTTADDVRRVAPLALAHRARRNPLDPPGIDEQRLSDALSDAFSDTVSDAVSDAFSDAVSDAVDEHAPAPPHHPPPPPPPDAPDPAPDAPPPSVLSPGEKVVEPAAPDASLVDVRPPPPARSPLPRAASGRARPVEGARGRLIGARVPDGPAASVAVGATVRAAVARRASGPTEGPLVAAADLRQAVRVHRSAHLIVVVVDASGSMGADERMAATKGAVVGLLLDAYQRRDLVALVAFRRDEAEVLLRPTASVEVAHARLAELPTGGRTPLAAGIRAGLAVAGAPARASTHRPLMVLITDGRATSGPEGIEPLVAAEDAARAVARTGISAVVVDVEAVGGIHGARLGLAARLATAMGASHVPLRQVTPEAVRAAVAVGLSE